MVYRCLSISQAWDARAIVMKRCRLTEMLKSLVTVLEKPARVNEKIARYGWWLTQGRLFAGQRGCGSGLDCVRFRPGTDRLPRSDVRCRERKPYGVREDRQRSEPRGIVAMVPSGTPYEYSAVRRHHERAMETPIDRGDYSAPPDTESVPDVVCTEGDAGQRDLGLRLRNRPKLAQPS